jgi:hypothetical protein
MFIGNRRTTHAIRAYRSPAHLVVIPRGVVLRDVRPCDEPGYQVPLAMKIAVRKNPAMYVFEYRGETLYMHFSNGLIAATMVAVEE